MFTYHTGIVLKAPPAGSFRFFALLPLLLLLPPPLSAVRAILPRGPKFFGFTAAGALASASTSKLQRYAWYAHGQEQARR